MSVRSRGARRCGEISVMTLPPAPNDDIYVNPTPLSVNPYVLGCCIADGEIMGMIPQGEGCGILIGKASACGGGVEELCDLQWIFLGVN